MTDDQDIVYQDRELEAADEAAAVGSYWSTLKAKGIRGTLLDQLTRQKAFQLGGVVAMCDEACDCDEDPE